MLNRQEKKERFHTGYIVNDRRKRVRNGVEKFLFLHAITYKFLFVGFIRFYRIMSDDLDRSGSGMDNVTPPENVPTRAVGCIPGDNAPKVDKKTKRKVTQKLTSLEDPPTDTESPVQWDDRNLKGIQTYPKLVSNALFSDEGYECIKDDEECQFMKSICAFLCDVPELKEFNAGKLYVCVHELLMNMNDFY